MTMIMTTQPCVVCKQRAVLELSEEGYGKWRSGMLIQEALPELDADQRELLMSGTHAHCWQTMFGGDDE